MVSYRFGFEVRYEVVEVGGDIVFDGFGGLNDFIDVFGYDFELDDFIVFFGGGGVGIRGEFGDVEGDMVVEMVIESDD